MKRCVSHVLQQERGVLRVIAGSEENISLYIKIDLISFVIKKTIRISLRIIMENNIILLKVYLNNTIINLMFKQNITLGVIFLITFYYYFFKVFDISNNILNIQISYEKKL